MVEILPHDITAALARDGVLRAAINLGNPVLAQGSEQDPAGVTVELARSIGAELGVGVQFICVDAARLSFEALVRGEADIAFLAVEPARAEQVAFTPPYVVIDGVYVVPDASKLTTVTDVDQPGVRVGVKRGSAYDLFLTRTLKHAEIVRGDEGVDVYLHEALEVGAGIRQPLQRFVTATAGQRLIEERFMQIQQAIAVGKSLSADVVTWLGDAVRRRCLDGSVKSWLRESGQSDAEVASW